MDFLGIGPFEIALVVLIAFIVLGPDRIPGVMRQLGKWTRQLREFTNNITRDYGTDIRQLTGEITALQEELRSIQREIGQVATGFMTTTLPSDLESLDCAAEHAARRAPSRTRPRTRGQRRSTPPPAPGTLPDTGDTRTRYERLTQRKIMPLMGHLRELRNVLIKCAIALAIGAAISFAFTTQILEFLIGAVRRHPGDDRSHRERHHLFSRGAACPARCWPCRS